ncbi:hypothetical protein BC939DRAFT_121788 [Gamsiella multidivaricata]|uniref:uncharacterized protein n=1 Tax=Gamsiella multidivaricata TaxID=101098 RepID=UPI00222128E9|nr:uncharacterized protein BC939DRAFT_121788 [Gamsiella multidivaricata]KAI7825631.1 hypothetical protein BC939DRAFT_121788 [Gamsiella multidivaricata]
MVSCLCLLFYHPFFQFVVKSFVRADVSYIVRHNNDVTSIVSCSCADYCLHLIPCKHMYLVQRFYKSVRVSYSGEPAIESAIELAVAQEQHAQNMDFFGPDLEAGLAPLLRLQLDRKRAAEQEFERVAREVATRQEFEDNEGLLMELMKQMGAAVEIDQKRYRGETNACVTILCLTNMLGILKFVLGVFFAILGRKVLRSWFLFFACRRCMGRERLVLSF